MYSKSRLLVMNMCPGACVIANSGLDAITAACASRRTPENTGISPGYQHGGTTIGCMMSSMPIAGRVAHTYGGTVHGRVIAGNPACVRPPA